MRGQLDFDLPSIILTLILVFVILYMGTFAINATVKTQDTGGRVSQAALLDGTSYTTLADTVGKDEQVYNSLGYAINTTGASDSYFETTKAVDLANDDTWTVSVWARVDNGSESANMTALSAHGRVIVYYNGSASEWQVWYYDEGARTSYTAGVAAPNQPQNLTNVIVWSNGTHIAIYRNNTQGDLVNVSGSNIESAPVNNTNWDGRIEEVRTFDDALNSSQRQSLIDTPVEPLVSTNRTSRIMFDQPSKSTQLLFFASGGVSTSNATFSDGLNGEKMDAKTATNDLLGTSDYEWDVVGPRIRAVSGGELDGAPVAYVDYTRDSELDTLADDWNDAMALAAVLFIVLPMGAIIIYLKGMQGGR